VPNAPQGGVGKISQPREAWEQLIANAHRERKPDGTAVLDAEFFHRAALELLLDIREMLIVQNLISNQLTGLLAQAAGTPVEKRSGGVIIP